MLVSLRHEQGFGFSLVVVGSLGRLGEAPRVLFRAALGLTFRYA